MDLPAASGRLVQGGPAPRTRPRAGLCGIWILLLSSVAAAQHETDEALAPAEIMPLAAQSVLLDIVNTDRRAVAVGERGHVLLSEDRSTWRQASLVPTRSTLTAVTALGDELWAVGHDEVIIHSDDGGETWMLQNADPGQDGEAEPNPLFDVMFLDPRRGLAIGAYGRLLRTRDGGETWTSHALEDLIVEPAMSAGELAIADAELEGEAVDPAPADEGEYLDEVYYDYHLNALARLGDGTLVIAAEAGNSYRSMDGGESWSAVALPYEGSMFGIVATPAQELLAFGLRGHVLRSGDAGRSWEELETGSLNSLIGGTVLGDGTVVLVGANGEVLARPAPGAAFESFRTPAGSDLAGVAAILGRNLVVVGEEGVSLLSLGGRS